MMRPNWPVYTEKGSIRAFSWMFANEARTIGLPPELWISKYSTQLSGTAQRLAYTYLMQNDPCTFTQLREHLENSLERDHDSAAKQEFNSRTRKPGESFLEYATILRTMAVSAYGGSSSWTTLQMEERAAEVYIGNVKGAIGEKLRLSFPDSLDKAVQICRNLQASGLTDDQPTTISAVYNTPNRASGPPKGAGGTPKADIVCWFCQRCGHVKKDCYKWKNQQQDASKGGKHQKRGGAGSGKSKGCSSTKGKDGSKRDPPSSGSAPNAAATTT